MREWNGAEGTREIFKCNSQIDLTIVMDGSGSLGLDGWKKTKDLARDIVSNLTPNVSVALLLYSGPRTWTGVEKCLENTPGINMETNCSLKWVSRYTSDFEGLASSVESLSWPRGGTLTSMALGMVEADLVYGRLGAVSKVLVITDGKPLSNYNTLNAARKLQEKAEVIWVPIGRDAPLKMVKEMASKPKNDHVISITTFWKLGNEWNYWLNRIITTTCPDLA